MYTIKGQYNKAKVFADSLEHMANEQIQTLCDQLYTKGSTIRMMPDAHAGAGCTIGTTMTITDAIVPNLVGVDIGCGMLVTELNERDVDFAELDAVIKAYVPSGFAVRETPHKNAERVDVSKLRCFDKMSNKERAYLSLGTLGGGNHFIELDRDDDGNLYLVIHSGSRNIGKQAAEYYQNRAYEDCKKGGIYEYPHDLAYLSGEHMEDYLHDMKILQKYADINRHTMQEEILTHMNLTAKNEFTTMHNYIDIEDMILRKGAVSAEKGERLIIPMNMRDGSLICTGKGKADWNYSAPHGAGRTMSRNEARQTLLLTDFHNTMKGIYTTCVSMGTIDESPMAYKPMDEIVKAIQPTVSIEKIIKPVYNFKAEDEGTSWREKRQAEKERKKAQKV